MSLLLHLSIVLLFLAASTKLALVIYDKRSRPSSRIKSFRTRYENSPWSEEQIDLLICSFWKNYTERHPEDKALLLELLNNLNIYWVDKRWQREDTSITAEVENKTDIKVWRGPRTKKYGYKLIHSAIVEALTQLTYHNLHGQKLTTADLIRDYKDFLLAIKEDIREVSVDPPTPPSYQENFRKI